MKIDVYGGMQVHLLSEILYMLYFVVDGIVSISDSLMIPARLGSLLHQCSKGKAFIHGQSLHAAVLKTGLDSDVVTSNHVLNMYAKCGRLKPARQVFDEMSERNLVSWSAMISGYGQAGEPELAIELYCKMQLMPNEYILASVISACASVSSLIHGRQLHGQSLKLGCKSISFVSNSLMSMYMKCGRCNEALSVHGSTDGSNSVTFNALISGFVENNQPEKGFEVFRLMLQQGFAPDRFSFVGVLGICHTMGHLQRGTGLHCQTVKLNLDTTSFVGNVIIMMYSRFNMLEEAERAFQVVEEKDVISWNTLIAACSNSDDHVRGLKVFRKMVIDTNIRPDDFTFSGVLSVLAGLSSIRHGKEIHAHIMKTFRHQDTGVNNALVNMYAKCGSIDCALSVFNSIVQRNHVSWNTIIAGFGNHGLGERAMQQFEDMKTAGLKPDSVTFIGLLSACNHAGLVDECQGYFNSMEETYGVSPDIEHFACLIDSLGRAGKMNDAVEYLKRFPVWHDPVILGSLLSACRLHGEIADGQSLARLLLKEQPATTSPFVLLSNLYASDGMWNNVADARKMLKGSGLKKEPGQSLIEVKGFFENFIIGNFSHSEGEQIKDMLHFLSWAASEVAVVHLAF